MTENATSSASERLLDAAARLFYTRGVPNVGINEIIARAGVARMTFYHHFPSKDDLIKAVLERRRAERAAWLARADEMASTPRGQILAVFDLLSEWFTAPDYRGCPLLAATFELGGQLNAARPYARRTTRPCAPTSRLGLSQLAQRTPGRWRRSSTCCSRARRWWRWFKGDRRLEPRPERPPRCFCPELPAREAPQPWGAGWGACMVWQIGIGLTALEDSMHFARVDQ